MYSLILMAAMTTGPTTTPGIFFNWGCGGCSGYSCSGGGCGGGFLGLSRLFSFGGGGCSGCGGGCYGSSCYGTPVRSYSCGGCYGCAGVRHVPAYSCYGCGGGGHSSYSASYQSHTPVYQSRYGSLSSSEVGYTTRRVVTPVTRDQEDELAPPARRVAPDRARLIVDVPAEAKLYVDGYLSRAENQTTRSFVTPPLEEGAEYYYNLRVETVLDGKTVSESRRVVIRPGREHRASFTQTAAQPVDELRQLTLSD